MRQAGIVLALCSGLDVSAAASQATDLPTLAVDFELETEIGSDLGEPEYVFGDVREVAVGPDGQIAVLDAMASEVRVFDSSGQFVRALGGKGGGPGEFIYPIDLFEDTAGIVVVDPQSGRNTVFSWSGALIETRPLPLLEGRRLAIQVSVAHSYVVGLGMAGWSTANFEVQTPESIVAFQPGAEHVDTLAQYDPGGIRWRSNRGAGALPGFHEPGGAWAVLNDSTVLTADGITGELTLWTIGADGARALRRISTQLRPNPLTPDNISAAVEKTRAQLRRGSPDQADLMTRSPETIGPKYWSGIRSIIVEREDRIWLEVGRGAEGYFNDVSSGRWYVLDLVTESFHLVDVPEGLRPRKVRHDLLYGTAHTEFDSDVVRVYRVVYATRDSF